MGYTKTDIDDYKNRLTEKQKDIVVKHCNEFNIKPEICAWYDDMDDFESAWTDELGIPDYDWNSRFNEGLEEGEFLVFGDGQIIRFSL